MSFKVCEIVIAQKLIRAGEGLLLGGRPPSAVNLPNLNYFKSIEFSSIRATIMPLKVCEIVQRAYVDPTRGAVTQRSEPPQPRLLGQTFRFFNYF